MKIKIKNWNPEEIPVMQGITKEKVITIPKNDFILVVNEYYKQF